MKAWFMQPSLFINTLSWNSLIIFLPASSDLAPKQKTWWCLQSTKREELGNEKMGWGGEPWRRDELLEHLLELLPPKEVRLHEEGLNLTLLWFQDPGWMALQASSLALSLILQTTLTVPSFHLPLEPKNSCSPISLNLLLSWKPTKVLLVQFLLQEGALGFSWQTLFPIKLSHPFMQISEKGDFLLQ